MLDDINVKSLNTDQLAELRSKRFGFIFQRYNLITSLKASENVSLPAIYSGVRKYDRVLRAKKLLDKLDLQQCYDKKPSQMSGGQQQRVSIARALMNYGDIILADEPTGALDSNNGKIVLDILKELNNTGITVILITHDSNIAKQANRVVEIKDGVIIDDKRLCENTDVFVKQQKQTINKTNKIRYVVYESLLMSMKSIISRKLRSGLTIFGVAIGIFSVINVLAFSNGLKRVFDSMSKEFCGNTLFIMSGHNWDEHWNGVVTSMSESDLKAIQQKSYVQYASPIVDYWGNAIYNHEEFRINCNGGNKDFPNMMNLSIIEGRNFCDDDIIREKPVVIVDQKMKDQVFHNESPIGKSIMIENACFEIIGVSTSTPLRGGAAQHTIFAPYTSVIQRLKKQNCLDEIHITIKENYDMNFAKDETAKLFKFLHGEEDFILYSNDTWLAEQRQRCASIELIMLAIAGIVILVGGIGVMNIMLVSVKERIKEIGIRIAIGAKSSYVMLQFFMESIITCFIGGIFGIVLTYGFKPITKMMNEVQILYTYDVIIFALVFSSIIGAIFGYLPAKNAAKMNPTDALQNE